jgi:hypothetical protein
VRWLDVGIPALDGERPRAAVLHPAERDRVVRPLKEHIRKWDEAVLRGNGFRVPPPEQFAPPGQIVGGTRVAAGRCPAGGGHPAAQTGAVEGGSHQS